ncbi:MAG: hypothetical protein HQL31_00320 [Planctomycetes bacterium]|nr:hypothetical protein [Planctomycetota bacterium]
MTTCVRILSQTKDVYICDAGTGIAPCGEDVAAEGEDVRTIHLFISHTHWDHIAGFMHFEPLWRDAYQIFVYSCHCDIRERIEYSLPFKHSAHTLNDVAAKLEFVRMDPGVSLELGGIRVTPMLQSHPAESFAFIFEKQGRKIIFSTDSDYTFTEALTPGSNAFSNADILTMDCQYTFSEFMQKSDWGHGNPFSCVDFAVREKVRRLLLCHHDPAYGDDKVRELHHKAQRYLAHNYPASDLLIDYAQDNRSFLLEKSSSAIASPARPMERG